ncbi:MAG: response regulator [Synechococcaceae cyanobacterium SM2_3_60]|nr:response regulator [Synechococcaceae cyanobacterium SM2_3_60]
MLTLEATKSHQQDVRLGRVLVVEDEELIRETVALALSEEGYEVLTAEDGRSALDLACKSEEGNYPEFSSLDLIILDLMLPYISYYYCLAFGFV